MPKSKGSASLLRGVLWLLVALFVAGVVIVAWLARPLTLPPLTATPHPARSYVEAMEKFSTIQIEEAKLPLFDGGRSILLTHGHPTEHVFVLLHGFTNAPRQFREMGERLLALGANVIIPRLAYHGFADRLTEAHAALTAEDMIRHAETGVDIARGLGRRVTVVGLSLSGASTAWIIQRRGDIETACLLAPFLGLPGIPDSFTAAATRILLRLPNKVLWWDPRTRENIAGPPTNYPRYATHPLAEILRIGLEAEEWKGPVQVKRLVLVLSESDIAINNARAQRLVNQWCANSPQTDCSIHVFPASDRVIHDFIDPLQPRAQIEKVYPQLFEWILPEEWRKPTAEKLREAA